MGPLPEHVFEDSPRAHDAYMPVCLSWVLRMCPVHVRFGFFSLNPRSCPLNYFRDYAGGVIHLATLAYPWPPSARVLPLAATTPSAIEDKQGK